MPLSDPLLFLVFLSHPFFFIFSSRFSSFSIFLPVIHLKTFLGNNPSKANNHLQACTRVIGVTINIMCWTHGKPKGVTLLHIMCNSAHVRAGAGNGLHQLSRHAWLRRKWNTGKPHAKFPTTLFVRFLLYVGFHTEIPLHKTALHTHEKRNVRYAMIHTSVMAAD